MLVPAPGKHNYFLAVARPIAAIKMPKKKERDAVMRAFGVVRAVPLDISMCIRGKINRNRYANHYGRFFFINRHAFARSMGAIWKIISLSILAPERRERGETNFSTMGKTTLKSDR